MKRILILSVVASILSGCAIPVAHVVPKDSISGSDVTIYSTLNQSQGQAIANRLCGKKAYFKDTDGSYSQWFTCDVNDAARVGNHEAEKDQFSMIPTDEGERKTFFRTSEQVFMALDCGWMDNVAFSVGKYPMVFIAGTAYPGTNPKYKDGIYTYEFNDNSMQLFFDTHDHTVSVITLAGHAITSCHGLEPLSKR